MIGETSSGTAGSPVAFDESIYDFGDMIHFLCATYRFLFRTKVKGKTGAFVANGRLVPALQPQRKGQP